MKCGNCGYKGLGATADDRWRDLIAHLKTHPPRVITDLSEIFPAGERTT